MSLESFNKTKQKQGAYLDELGAKLAEMDHLAMVDAAEEKGEARGKAEGRAEGKAAGLAEGEAKASHEIAANMLQKGYAPTSISEVTGLSETEISRLKNGK